MPSYLPGLLNRQVGPRAPLLPVKVAAVHLAQANQCGEPDAVACAAASLE